MGNIAVFFGGNSVEHDISIITGVMVCNSLLRGENVAIPVYIAKSGKWLTGKKLLDIESYKDFNEKGLKEVYFLPNSQNIFIKNIPFAKKMKVHCAINCLHGGSGESGSLFGLIDYTSIPFASPNNLISSICMDKSATKIMLKGLNVKCLPYFSCNSVKNGLIKAEKFIYPLIVKSNSLGSSIGISRVKNSEQLASSIKNALKYDRSVIVEPLLTDFTEINCACYKNSCGELVVSECEKPLFKGDIMTFSDKYLGNATREFPAKIDIKLSNKIKRITALIYQKLNANGIIRADFMIKEGTIYLNEINTVPGSLSYYLFCDTFTKFSQILQDIIKLAMENKDKEKRYIKNFSSSALSIGGVKGIKKVEKI